MVGIIHLHHQVAPAQVYVVCRVRNRARGDTACTDRQRQLRASPHDEPVEVTKNAKGTGQPFLFVLLPRTPRIELIVSDVTASSWVSVISCTTAIGVPQPMKRCLAGASGSVEGAGSPTGPATPMISSIPSSTTPVAQAWNRTCGTSEADRSPGGESLAHAQFGPVHVAGQLYHEGIWEATSGERKRRAQHSATAPAPVPMGAPMAIWELAAALDGERPLSATQGGHRGPKQKSACFVSRERSLDLEMLWRTPGAGTARNGDRRSESNEN